MASWTQGVEGFDDAIDRVIARNMIDFRCSEGALSMVWDAVKPDEASDCLKLIPPLTEVEKRALSIADSVGAPPKCKIGDVTASATAVRQLYYLIKALLLCPTMPKSIIEFGGGFGCLAALAIEITGCARYTIYDLPHVGELQRQYLDNTGVNRVYDTFCPCDSELPISNYDLAISTWAFNELDIETAELYKPLIQASSHGFVAGHWIGNKSLSLDQWKDYRRDATHRSYVPYNGFTSYITEW